MDGVEKLRQSIGGKDPVRVHDLASILRTLEQFCEFNTHIAELFGPARFKDNVVSMGLTAGVIIDLDQVDPVTGEAFDMSIPRVRTRAWLVLEECKPFSVIGPQRRTASSQMFESSSSRMDPQRGAQVIAECLAHLRFSFEVYAWHLKNVMQYLHEHPAAAWSWLVTFVTDFVARTGGIRVNGDQCMYEQYVRMSGGERALIMKQAGWLTNSAAITTEVCDRCPNKDKSTSLWQRHTHGRCEGSVTKRGQLYP